MLLLLVFGRMSSEVKAFYCKSTDLVNAVGLGPMSPISPIGPIDPIDPTEADFYFLPRRDNRPPEPLGLRWRISVQYPETEQ